MKFLAAKFSSKVFALTARDLSILIFVREYQAVTAEMVQRRFFQGRGPCYRRIALLVKADILASRRLPSLSGQGSGKAILTIGPAGRPLLSEALGIPLAELERA